MAPHFGSSCIKALGPESVGHFRLYNNNLIHIQFVILNQMWAFVAGQTDRHLLASRLKN